MTAWSSTEPPQFTYLPPGADVKIELQRNELRRYSQEHPLRAQALGNLASSLYSRFKRLGRQNDLNEAVSLERDALKLCIQPGRHPYRVTSLASLACYLYSRFKLLGTLCELEEAINLERDALKLRPQWHPDRAASLGSLASYLHSRFRQLGTLSDLEEAITFGRETLKLRKEWEPNRATSLGSLAGHLHSRFKQLGTLTDLEEAITLGREALKRRLHDHPNRATALGSLAGYLYSRFRWLETLSDLEEAIDLECKALELYSQRHPNRATSLGSLASYYHSRFEQLGTLSDLEEAIALGRETLKLRKEWEPHRATSLGSLADHLHSRFKQLGMLPDLEEAITLGREALKHRPHGHLNRATSLGSLASYLRSRSEWLGTSSDLGEALSFHRNTLELRPHGHPLRALSLSGLAHCLTVRFKRSTMHDMSDLQESFDVYFQLSQVSQTVSSASLECAKNWIQAAEEWKHDTTILAYETFLCLTVHHLATLPSLPQHLALLKKLTTSIAVDAFSACVRYGNLANAVELLEHGRGIFWSQLLRLRSPLDEVIESDDTGTQLADKFTQLACSLRVVLDDTFDTGSQHDRACCLSVHLQNIVIEVRKLPGLSRFLLPPLFPDLQVAAVDGPVVIVNASQYSCNALIVLSDRDPLLVALPITKAGVSELSLQLHSLKLRSRLNDVTREFRMFLRQLWDIVVSPIVEVLQEFCLRGSRIWWCPTAEFSLLPLHAAGSFRKGQPLFSDLYISSYTSTLTALIRARQKSRPSDPPIEWHSFLAIGHGQAPGHCELASVNTELSSISRLIEPVATLTLIQDQDATISKVSEELKRNEFVHLACHGVSRQRRPFESGFALDDGLLKVEDIMRYNLQNAQFAYLSACNTTVGDEESPDEVIHLAAAMQFAGFRSVIGTMWAVDDTHANEVASKFYKHMLDDSGHLDHTRAALALHRTMQSLRSSEVPLDQRILYVHIGA